MNKFYRICLGMVAKGLGSKGDQQPNLRKNGVATNFSVFVGVGVDSDFFEKPNKDREPEFNFMNKSVLLRFKQAIPAS